MFQNILEHYSNIITRTVLCTIIQIKYYNTINHYYNNLVKGYLPQSLIKQRINQKVRDQDAKAWANSGHRHSKMTLGKKHHQILKDMKKLLKDRIGYRAAVQLITGHAGLNDHLYKMKLVNSKICPLCESEDETVGHFLVV